MAKYLIPGPAYVNGKYLGQDATVGNPATIEVPDDLVPSGTWTPLDKAAQEALVKLGKHRITVLTEGMDPQKDKTKIDRINSEIARTHLKEIPIFVEKKAPIREVQEPNTNTEITEQRTAKVVGRASDKSPV